MTILQDLLNDELTENNIRVIVQKIYDVDFGDTYKYSNRPKAIRSKTPGNAKSLLEFYDLVRRAIINYETRQGVIENQKIVFTEEEPDADSASETITFSLVRREPGSFGQGAPFESNVKNLKPMIRESIPDPEVPGYRRSICGYWYDNIVRFTCWARTNKAANKRVEWFESLLQDYDWWFKAQGVDRVIYWGQDKDIVATIDNNKWYGRPIDIYVRTEKIKVFSEKTLEEILISLSVDTE